MSRVKARITYSTYGGKPETHTITGNVIRENGAWGVNYTSTLRED